MRFWVSRYAGVCAAGRRRTAASVVAGSCLLASAAALATAVEQRLQFDVQLDDRTIGRHEFVIRDRNDALRVVDSSADFEVSVLFVPVFRYRHQNTEVWRDGCLSSINASTDSNGKRYRVDGRLVDDGFVVDRGDATRQLGRDCVMSFAYWDPRILDQKALLNAQTGELVAVSVESVGQTELTVGGAALRADTYRIRSQDGQVDITLYYRPVDRQWLALESVLPNGRLIRYLPADTERLALLQGDGDRRRMP